LARAGKSRTFTAAVLAWFVIARLVEFRLVKTSLFELSCAVAGTARIAADVIRRARVALLPRFCLATIRPKIFARTTVRRAARKFLVAEFLVEEARCRAGFAAVATRRAIGKRPILPVVTVEARGARRIVAITARWPFAFAGVWFA